MSSRGSSRSNHVDEKSPSCKSRDGLVGIRVVDASFSCDILARWCRADDASCEAASDGTAWFTGVLQADREACRGIRAILGATFPQTVLESSRSPFWLGRHGR